MTEQQLWGLQGNRDLVKRRAEFIKRIKNAKSIEIHTGDVGDEPIEIIWSNDLDIAREGLIKAFQEWIDKENKEFESLTIVKRENAENNV